MALRSSLTSRSSSFTRCASAVVKPSRTPVLTSTRLTYSLSVFGLQPILGAMDLMAAHRDGYSPLCTCTRRTARFRTSGENFFDFFMAQSSQRFKPPQNTGRFSIQGTLPVDILDMLNDDVTTLPATVAPIEAYAQVARRWAGLEKAIAAETLDALSLKLQLMRLDLYQTTGQYLSKQAAFILSEHLVDEEWTEHGDIHLGRATLESCLSEPFLSRWPEGAKTRLTANEISGTVNDE